MMKCVIDDVIFGDPRYLQLKSYDSILEVGELRVSAAQDRFQTTQARRDTYIT